MEKNAVAGPGCVQRAAQQKQSESTTCICERAIRAIVQLHGADRARAVKGVSQEVADRSRTHCSSPEQHSFQHRHCRVILIALIEGNRAPGFPAYVFGRMAVACALVSSKSRFENAAAVPACLFQLSRRGGCTATNPWGLFP